MNRSWNTVNVCFSFIGIKNHQKSITRSLEFKMNNWIRYKISMIIWYTSSDCPTEDNNSFSSSETLNGRSWLWSQSSEGNCCGITGFQDKSKKLNKNFYWPKLVFHGYVVDNRWTIYEDLWMLMNVHERRWKVTIIYVYV